MKTLLTSGHSCSIATHDPALLQAAAELVSQHDLNRDAIEFEMLHGITLERRLQAATLAGYQTRTYLPYGTEWYLYVCHRLAEYPPNIYRAIADVIGNQC
jgi:proline dehydrogenase